MLVPRSMFHLHELGDPDAQRFALNGVRIERRADGRPIAVATDGRRMLVVRWEEDPTEEYPSLGSCDPSPNGNTLSVTIPRDACRKASKLAEGAKKSGKAILARNVVLDEHSFDPQQKEDQQEIRLGATDLEESQVITVKTQPGRFPNFCDVFMVDSHLEAATRIKLDVKLLRTLLATLEKLMADDPSHERGVVFSVTDHQHPVYISYDGYRTQAAGVIMPLAPHDESAPPVGWIPRSVHPATEANAPAKPLGKPDGEAEKEARRLEELAARQQRLLGELDRVRNECIRRGGPKFEALAEVVRRVYATYSQVAWDDTKSLDNCEQCLEQARERLARHIRETEAKVGDSAEGEIDARVVKTRKGPTRVSGTHEDGTWHVYPKQRIEIGRSDAVLTFELGKSAFFDEDTAGRITTIGPKLVAIEDAEGKKHWLSVDRFVTLNNNG